MLNISSSLDLHSLLGWKRNLDTVRYLEWTRITWPGIHDPSSKFTKVRDTCCINKHVSDCCPNALRPNGPERFVPGQLPKAGTGCAGCWPAGNSLPAPGAPLGWCHRKAGVGPETFYNMKYWVGGPRQDTLFKITGIDTDNEDDTEVLLPINQTCSSWV